MAGTTRYSRMLASTDFSDGLKTPHLQQAASGQNHQQQLQHLLAVITANPYNSSFDPMFALYTDKKAFVKNFYPRGIFYLTTGNGCGRIHSIKCSEKGVCLVLLLQRAGVWCKSGIADNASVALEQAR